MPWRVPGGMQHKPFNLKILTPAYNPVSSGVHTSALQKLPSAHEDDTDFDVRRGHRAEGNDRRV